MRLLSLYKFNKSQNGQILLIVVLTMVVALTVGLSIASRIVTELRLSKQNEESERAFQAAEAGIEESLRSGSNIPSSNFLNNSSFSTEFITIAPSGTLIVNNGLEIDQTSGADVWLSTYSSNPALNFGSPITGTATLYWGNPTTQTSCSSGSGADTIPAIEVVILQRPAGVLGVKKYVFEGDGCTRIPGVDVSSSNNQTVFDVSTGTTIQYSNFASIDYSNGLIMKVIPIYNSTIVALEVSSGPPFPLQGSTVESTGTSGDTVRKVKFFRSFPQMPIEVFPYSILSQ